MVQFQQWPEWFMNYTMSVLEECFFDVNDDGVNSSIYSSGLRCDTVKGMTSSFDGKSFIVHAEHIATYDTEEEMEAALEMS